MSCENFTNRVERIIFPNIFNYTIIINKENIYDAIKLK